MPTEPKVVLYNTLTRATSDLFTGEKEGRPLTIYTCGPTVYNHQHIGNYRTFVFEDVLVKSLRWLGVPVERIMNITDVGHLTSDEDEGEDKLEVGARREGSTAWEVAKKYEDSFIQDCEELHIEVPTLIRATDTIAEQITLIQQLESKGFTYQTSDGLYFDSSRFPTYGELAHLDIAGLQAGSRVEMGEKKQATDFALWKFSAKGVKRDMEWESPWGKGFPGWHIECSAIAINHLGAQIDIHTGGVDHIPVHHTNEIAQSEAATGQKPFARIWMHGEFLLVNSGKMSKSLGNVYILADLKKRGFDPLALRMFYYTASYRTKQNFTWEALQAAQTSLERLRQAAQETEQEEMTEAGEEWIAKVKANLANDLNMPGALATLWEMVRSDLPAPVRRAVLKEVDQVFSLNVFQKSQLELPKAVQELIEAREEARKAQEWSRADELRGNISAMGYEIEDSSGGEYKIHKKSNL